MSDDTKISGYEIDHLGIPSKGPKDCRRIKSSVMILQPKSPTKSSVDESSLLAFVEKSYKDSFIDNICPWEDIICAFSAPFLFRYQTGASIPNVDLQMYWCNFCEYKSQEKREMIKHSMTHRFKCNYCDKESFCRIGIIKHSFDSHPEYKKIRKDLKVCVLLGDVLGRDETVMMSGSQNQDKELLNRNDTGRNLFDSHHSSLDPVCLTTTRMPIVVHDERTNNTSMLLSSSNSSLTNLTRGQPGDLNSSFEIIDISPSGSPVNSQPSLISDDKCTSDSTNGRRTLPPELNASDSVNAQENGTAVITADGVNSDEASPMDTTCDTIAIAGKVNILQITTPIIKLSPPQIGDTEMTVTEITEPSEETEPSEKTEMSEKTKLSEETELSEKMEPSEKMELSKKKGLTEMPQSMDPVFSPLITSVEMLRNDDNQTISNLPPIDLITTVQPLAGTDLPIAPINKNGDITNPSMPVLKQTKGGNASDSDSTLDNDDVDPDYIPEAKHHKNSRVTRNITRYTPQKKKIETQNPKATKGKIKKNLKDEGKPTTHFWRCGYCLCRSVNMEKISAHQKEKHKGKLPKCLSVIYSKYGEIVQEPSKEQIIKVQSPLKSPIPSSATPESETIPEHNINKAASECISDPQDAGNKKDLRCSCIFCDHKYNDM